VIREQKAIQYKVPIIGIVAKVTTIAIILLSLCVFSPEPLFCQLTEMKRGRELT
jgi:hypothetical protein